MLPPTSAAIVLGIAMKDLNSVVPISLENMGEIRSLNNEGSYWEKKEEM